MIPAHLTWVHQVALEEYAETLLQSQLFLVVATNELGLRVRVHRPKL